jgi:hypothetical protein
LGTVKGKKTREDRRWMGFGLVKCRIPSKGINKIMR